MSAQQARRVRTRKALVRCAERVVWDHWDGTPLHEPAAWPPLWAAVRAQLPALTDWTEAAA